VIRKKKKKKKKEGEKKKKGGGIRGFSVAWDANSLLHASVCCGSTQWRRLAVIGAFNRFTNFHLKLSEISGLRNLVGELFARPTK